MDDQHSPIVHSYFSGRIIQLTQMIKHQDEKIKRLESAFNELAECVGDNEIEVMGSEWVDGIRAKYSLYEDAE